MTIIYVLVTVLCWGMYMPITQSVPFRSSSVRTFWVAAGTLALFLVVAAIRSDAWLSWRSFWPPMAGGVIWTVSAFAAFKGIERVGLARASGVWAPLNIAVGFVWGALLFGELTEMGTVRLIALAVAVLLMTAGMLLIIFAKSNAPGSHQPKNALAGIAYASVAGVLWGTYFIPARWIGVSPWAASLPMGVGMVAGAVAILATQRLSPRLERPAHTGRAFLSGLLFGIGNCSMLFMVEALGTGKGFAIAQLAVVVNALIGIFVFRDPRPSSRAAILTICGIVLALGGGFLLQRVG